MSVPATGTARSERNPLTVTRREWRQPIDWIHNAKQSSVGVARRNAADSVIVKIYKSKAGDASLREPEILRRIKGRYNTVPPYFVNIILGEYRVEEYKHVILEHCSEGNLKDWRARVLERPPRLPFPEKKIWDIYGSLVAALKFLKYGDSGRPGAGRSPDWKHIFHRDIKPANVLVRSHGPDQPEDFVLCDFGLAVEKGGLGWDKLSRRRCGTGAWMAPELFYCMHQSHIPKIVPLPGEKLDVWGIGAVVHFLALGRPPIAHRIDTPYPEKPRKHFKIALPRAPTFIDMASTGTGSAAGCEPGNTLYSRQLNCRMMEALAFNPRKRASVDRLDEQLWIDADGVHHERWPTNPWGLFWPPFIHVPGWGKDPCRPSPPHRRYAEHNYSWTQAEPSCTIRAMDCTGIPHKIARPVCRDADVRSTERRNSFDDWQLERRPDPYGWLTKKDYSSVRERFADIHSEVMQKLAQREKIFKEQRERLNWALVLMEYGLFVPPNLENFLEDIRTPFHTFPTVDAFLEEGRNMHNHIDSDARQHEAQIVKQHKLTMKVLRMCRRCARRTGLAVEDFVAHFDETATLPGWDYDDLVHHILESDSSVVQSSDRGRSPSEQSENQELSSAATGQNSSPSSSSPSSSSGASAWQRASPEAAQVKRESAAEESPERAEGSRREAAQVKREPAAEESPVRAEGSHRQAAQVKREPAAGESPVQAAGSRREEANFGLSDDADDEGRPSRRKKWRSRSEHASGGEGVEAHSPRHQSPHQFKHEAHASTGEIYPPQDLPPSESAGDNEGPFSTGGGVQLPESSDQEQPQTPGEGGPLNRKRKRGIKAKQKQEDLEEEQARKDSGPAGIFGFTPKQT